MKKTISFLLCAVMIFTVFANIVIAEDESHTVTVTMSEQGLTDRTAVESFTAGEVSFVLSIGTGSNDPAYYVPQLRVYTGNTMTVSAESSILCIEFTYSGTNTGNFSADTGTMNSKSKWVGEATSITFTNGGSQARIISMAITIEGPATTEPDPDPEPEYTTPEEILAAAYELEPGEVLSDGYRYTLSGVVTKIVTAYNSTYGNITVDIVVDEVSAENNTIRCYRLKDGTGIEAAAILAVNDHITVTGVIKNYNGTVEFDADCTIDEYEEGEHNEVVIYETPAEILAAAYELESGSTLSEGHEYTLEGVITEVNTEYSEDYKNITVTIAVDGVTAENNTIQCYRMKNATGVDGVDKIAVNDHIKVKGAIQKYGDIVEFKQNCTLEEYTLSPRFMTQQLSLAGDLGVHFYLDLSSLSEDERAASYMEFTANEKTTRVDFDADHTNAKGTYYGFTCRINALQIAETITAVYHYGDKTVQKKYSAADYILYIAEHIDDYDKDTVLLAIAIWDYGYYAQQYLNECNNVALGAGGVKGEYNMIGNYLIGVGNDFDTETFCHLYAMTKNGDLSGGARFTYCLLLDSQIALEMYVTVPEGEEVQTIGADYEMDYYDQVEDLGGGRYRLTIANIPTTKLDEYINFVYAGNNCRILTPLSYAASVLHNENSSEKATDCMKALVNLFECARTYAENN